MGLVIWVCSVILAGCGTTSHVGRYYQREKKANFIDLRSNGTFHIEQNSRRFDGRYEIDEGLLILSLDKGARIITWIDEQVITDNEGKKWARNLSRSGPTDRAP